MKLITLHLPEPWIKALDSLVQDKMYGSRSHAIRMAIKDLLSEEAWKN